MRISGPILIVVFALLIAVVSFLLDDGFAKVASLQRSVEQQQRSNSKLAEGIQVLKREVNGLQNDPRVVEKAARSELGMVRPDEMIVIFEKKQEGASGASR
jgi:cell division protein FtsB